MSLRNLAFWLVGSLVVAGCNGGDGNGDDDTGDPPIPDGRDDCGDTPPTLGNIEIVAADPDWFETSSGIKCLPTIEITIQPNDVDGDLTYYKMDVWWDGVVDGRVLTDGPMSRIQGTLDGDDCEVFSVPGITMRLGIAGGGRTSPEFETETEFGVVVHDDADNLSNEGVPEVVSVVTPGPAVESDCPPR
jgi:hypothetical protein